MKKLNSLSRLIDFYGSQAKATTALGLKSNQVISNWKSRGAIPSANYALIVKATKGEITFEDLHGEAES